MIAATIATQQPVARDLRYLLTLDHVSYELERMGDHASSVAKQARKLAPYAPLKDYVNLPLLGERVADLVRGIIRALVDIDEHGARQVAALDDEVDDLYHRIFDETLTLMRDRRRQRRARDADPVRGALPRADRRPGDEHRRGHRVPRLGRGRGPQPVTADHDHGGFVAGGAAAPVRILVVCWGNSARSILAEALFRHLGGDRVEVHSAGIEPKGVNPLTLRVLEEAGMPTIGLRSKSVDEYLGQRFDYVITVCDDARDACPVFPGVHESLHWGYPDPAKAEGEEPQLAAFRSVFTGARHAHPPVPADRRAVRRRAPPGRARVIALYLLRHAHAGDAAKWSGDDDVRPLSEKGVRQCERVGRLLAGIEEAPDLFLTSPRLRASQTAEIVARAVGARVVVDERIAESLDIASLGAILASAARRRAAMPRRPRPGLLRAPRRAHGGRRRSSCARARSRASTSTPTGPRRAAGSCAILVPPELLPAS